MSIILRALKKIQNQKTEQAPPSEAQGSEDSPELEFDSSSQALPDAFPSEEPPPPSFRAGRDSLPDVAATGAVDLVKSSKITRVLLGLIVVLGLASTAWFATRIYSSYKAPAQGTLQARAEKAEQKAPAKQETKKDLAEVAPAAPAESPTVIPISPSIPAVIEKQAVEESAAPPAAPARTQQSFAVKTAPQPVEPAASVPLDSGAPAKEPAVKEAAPLSVASVSPLLAPRATENQVKEAAPVQVGKPELKINAIAWRALEPKAIVNMQRVYVGDMIEGAKVMEIRRKSIVFEYAGEQYEIRF